MTIEEALIKLKDLKVLDLKEIEFIRLGSLKVTLFREFNIEFNIKDLKEYMNNNGEFAEISNNFFVSKIKLKELLKNISKNKCKEFLENRYIIQVDENKLLNFLSYRKTVDELLKYGIENSYIKEEWLNDLNIEESDYTDIYEVRDELARREIKIR